MSEEVAAANDQQANSLKSIALVVYVLYSLSLFTAILHFFDLVFFPGQVFQSFQPILMLIGVSQFVATIVILLKQRAARGSWIASHFRWQLFTFLIFPLSAVVLLYLRPLLIKTGLANMLVISGGLYFWMHAEQLVSIAMYAWILYRVARGWRNLGNNKPVSI